MDDRERISIRMEIATAIAGIARDAKEKDERSLEYAANRMWHECKRALRDYDERRAAQEAREADDEH